jgi:hypothetical protein
MTTTSNNNVQRQGGNFKYNNLHDNKDEQLENNERRQQIFLQRGGSILNTTISMTMNVNDNDDNKQ